MVLSGGRFPDSAVELPLAEKARIWGRLAGEWRADLSDLEEVLTLETLSDAIEPIILVFLGMMVLILALGVFLPMWNLGSAMTG